MADTTILDALKRDVGDENNDYFSDDEYRSFIHANIFDEAKSEETAHRVQTTDLFRVNYQHPVFNLTLDDPQGNAFDIDAYSRVIENTDGNETRDELDVTYIRISYGHIVADVLDAIAADKSKLSIVQEAGGFQMRMEELRQNLRDEAINWRNRGF